MTLHNHQQPGSATATVSNKSSSGFHVKDILQLPESKLHGGASNASLAAATASHNSSSPSSNSTSAATLGQLLLNANLDSATAAMSHYSNALNHHPHMSHMMSSPMGYSSHHYMDQYAAMDNYSRWVHPSLQNVTDPYAAYQGIERSSQMNILHAI